MTDNWKFDKTIFFNEIGYVILFSRVYRTGYVNELKAVNSIKVHFQPVSGRNNVLGFPYITCNSIKMVVLTRLKHDLRIQKTAGHQEKHRNKKRKNSAHTCFLQGE